tara:strand:- start:186 stop:1607 length:1422 start_codon:yes stop_codon:yes gene_type:complete
MSPDTYEQYVYQKGTRDQLLKAITGSSIVTIYDKKINVNANYHIKKGKLLVLKKDQFQDDVNISLDAISAYYENNKESFYSNEEAEFEYIRLNKTNFIKSMKITDEELIQEYDIKSKSGAYKQDDLYEINHLVFPVKGDKPVVISEAEKALIELKNNISFSKIAENYNVNDDTKSNNGYLGKIALGDMPNIIKSNILDMKSSDIKLITTESNAIHILQLIKKERQDDKKFSEVREEVYTKLSNEKGSNEYYLTLDKIKNELYSDKISLVDIAKKFNLLLLQTPKINASYKNKILSSEVLQQLFSNLNDTDLYSPIYISNDDILFVRRVKYYPPEQLNLKDSEAAIRSLLRTQSINDLMSKKTNIALKNLNNGLLQSFEKFELYKYDDKFDDELMKIINNQSVTEKFVSYKLSSGNYLLLKLDSFEEIIDRERVESDNYFDYLENTQSEGDYNNFYISKYEGFVIDINSDYLNQ